MLEIEKKYRLTSERRASIEDTLRELGANFVRDDFEENTIYGGEVLGEVPSIVRIRRTQDRSVLTYKRKLESISDVRHQIELESEISNPDAVANG